MDYEIFDVNAESDRCLQVYTDLKDYRLGKEIRTYGFGSLLLSRMRELADSLWRRSEHAQKKRDYLRALAESFGVL